MDKNFIGRLNDLRTDIIASIKELVAENGGKLEFPKYNDESVEWDAHLFVTLVEDEFGSTETYVVESIDKDGQMLCKENFGNEYEANLECPTVEDLQYIYYYILDDLKEKQSA